MQRFTKRNEKSRYEDWHFDTDLINADRLILVKINAKSPALKMTFSNVFAYELCYKLFLSWIMLSRLFLRLP
jgi:hypothetical protein